MYIYIYQKQRLKLANSQVTNVSGNCHIKSTIQVATLVGKLIAMQRSWESLTWADLCDSAPHSD